MPDRILTLHPDGKEGVNISSQKYEMIRDAILSSLADHEQLTFQKLIDSVREKVEKTFEGSIPWYVTTIKLDLEARGMILCKRGKGPQKIVLGEVIA